MLGRASGAALSGLSQYSVVSYDIPRALFIRPPLEFANSDPGLCAPYLQSVGHWLTRVDILSVSIELQAESDLHEAEI